MQATVDHRNPDRRVGLVFPQRSAVRVSPALEPIGIPLRSHEAHASLVDFPYVLVRLPCDTCKRAGSYAHTTEARDRADGTRHA